MLSGMAPAAAVSLSKRYGAKRPSRTARAYGTARKQRPASRSSKTRRAWARQQAARRAKPKAEPRGFLGRLSDAILPSGKVTRDVRRQTGRAAKIRRAKSIAQRPKGKPTLQRRHAPLNGVRLALGRDLRPGMRRLREGSPEGAACLTKGRRQATFCIVEVDRATEIRRAFQVNTIFYQGSRAIARFDRGRARQFHALFDARYHAAVLAYMRKRFGKPTDFWNRTIAPFERPRQSNPTYIWRSRNPNTKVTTVLEVRKFDDGRDVFPDTEHGSIRLYVAGTAPVFPSITPLDIMSIDWAFRPDQPDQTQPNFANTLPVGR